nr:hypothetical protein [Acidobacteriota bacterium]NIM60443.1 hypothetical protein [Acidobacteriota bacterium]NIO59661.1 hypothetical protein [Acidobacteriota bacterium]NIQ30755.1 hypothetical protein [Acidobacteriota bacterium]NIQ84380.1 hypothetical protein [Acidobacteriota bacterium]
AWFASAEGASAEPLVRTLSRANVERLAEEGGACIIYTHLGEDCWSESKLHAGFVEAMTRLSKMNGWFVPVYQLLDYVVEKKGIHTLTPSQRRSLERAWLWDKVRRRGRP